jgi:hypothetical protein
MMEGEKTIPTNAALYFFDALAFPNHDAQGLAVQRIASFHGTNRECGGGHCCGHWA